MLENEDYLIALPKAETLTSLAQIATFLVLVVPAYGYLVVSHYLANYGLQSIYIPKSQLFAAGFATILAFLVAPAVAGAATSLMFRFIKSVAHKCAFFTVFYAFLETLMLKLLYVPFPSVCPKLIWLWVTAFALLVCAIATCLLFPPTPYYGRIVERFSGIKKRSAINAHVRQWLSLAILLLSFILGLYVLYKIDHTILILVSSLTLLSSLCYTIPKILTNESYLGKKSARLWSITAMTLIYPWVFMGVQGAIYGYLDSAWGGAGLNYVSISLEEQSGMLAPCTWKVHLIEETENAYYVTFDHSSNYTNAYMVPKTKVSGLFLHENSSVLDLAPQGQAVEPTQPTQVRAQQAICSALPAFNASRNNLVPTD